MITFIKGRQTYEWSGGFGAIFKSWERGVKIGDVRIIENELFYAYYVKRTWFKKAEIWWTKPGPFAHKDVSAIKAIMLGER